MEGNPIAELTKTFAKRIVKAYQYLNKNETVMSKQLYRSGTAIGALVKEAEFAQSRADFINKMSIALKEANESRYWIELLHYGEYLNNQMFESLDNDVKSIISMLVKIVHTSKQNKESLIFNQD